MERLDLGFRALPLPPPHAPHAEEVRGAAAAWPWPPRMRLAEGEAHGMGLPGPHAPSRALSLSLGGGGGGGRGPMERVLASGAAVCMRVKGDPPLR